MPRDEEYASTVIEKLEKSVKFQAESYVQAIVQEFDKVAKKRFKGTADAAVKFSNHIADREPEVGIRNGSLKLTKYAAVIGVFIIVSPRISETSFAPCSIPPLTPSSAPSRTSADWPSPAVMCRFVSTIQGLGRALIYLKDALPRRWLRRERVPLRETEVAF